MGLKESVSVPVSTTGKNMYCREDGNATRGAVELRAEMPNEINTIQNAWNVICEFEYLVEADHSARKGKRYRAEVLAFTANLEHNLFQIQEQMIPETVGVRAEEAVSDGLAIP